MSATPAFGINLYQVGYDTPDFPYLNFWKQGGPWAGRGVTGNVQVDSNGYPTTMVSSGGGTFTRIDSAVGWNTNSFAAAADADTGVAATGVTINLVYA